MVASRHEREVRAHGHVAVYARDVRWRRAVGRALAECGHSRNEAATPEEIHRLLLSQRFDVLTLKVRDAAEADEIVRALDGVRLPHHGILVGSASAMPAVFGPARSGTFRYVPGKPSGAEVCRLVDVSLSAGVSDDGLADHDAPPQLEDIDLEEAIDSAAAAVYAQAKRRGQRFSSLVDGPGERALGDPATVARVFGALLRLVVTLAPRGAHVSVEARAGRDEWTVRFAAGGKTRPGASLADALGAQGRTLAAVSNDVQSQGGLLWAELGARAAFAFCLTLPLPADAQAHGTR